MEIFTLTSRSDCYIPKSRLVPILIVVENGKAHVVVMRHRSL